MKKYSFITMINKYLRLPLLFVFLFFIGCDNDSNIESSSSALSTNEPSQLTLAVLPYMAPPRILDTFEPLASYLSEKTGVIVRIKTSSDFDKFTQQTLLNRYDVVISNPYLYLKLHKQGNYVPLIADTNPFQAVFITRKSSNIRSINDTKGKRIGVLPKGALAGHLLPIDHLRQNKINKNNLTLIEFNSFDLILTALLDNKIDVGCFWLPYYDVISEKNKPKLRIFSVTTKFVLDPYAVRNDLPENVKNKLRKAFLELNVKNEKNKRLLDHTGVGGFTEVNDNNYNQMREFAKRNKLEY